MVAKALFSAVHNDWNTPAELLREIRKFAPIGLDPCSNEHSVVNATHNWNLAEGKDGLLLDWTGKGLVFVNPPYTRSQMPKWMAKCNESGCEVIALVPHRSDTAWYQKHTTNLRAKCELSGRLQFGRKGEVNTPKAPFPSVLLYWGATPHLFEQVFLRLGVVWIK